MRRKGDKGGKFPAKSSENSFNLPKGSTISFNYFFSGAINHLYTKPPIFTKIKIIEWR